MNLPVLVFPYQRPLLWYTLLSVLTQTFPDALAEAISESEALLAGAGGVFLLAVLEGEDPEAPEAAGALAAGAGVESGAGVDAGAAAEFPDAAGEAVSAFLDL